ncbi:hypothetical protein ACEZDB_02955 [Streptacidiphilus sp. N1-3]|uniref:Uncharacterized protein n=1 Tax=Streptacidiphilus alkalitolerans TaxID=3342712 RepID=A0ABV6WV44_9ACTN
MTLTMPTTTVRCTYCQEPAEGLRAWLIRHDRRSPVVAMNHEACYPQFIDDLVLIEGGVEGAYPTPGSCHLCGKHTQRARVVAEIHSEAGAGATVVRCLECCKNPP